MHIRPVALRLCTTSVILMLWVDADSGLPVRGKSVLGTVMPGGGLPYELDQGFVGYGDSVRIDAPAR